jgi:hypothetical protein
MTQFAEQRLRNIMLGDADGLERAMERFLPERDWKTLRELHSVALDRYCQRALREIAGISGDHGRSAHERYLTVYDLVRQRNREMADAFDDMRRSQALERILWIRRLGLFTEEEYSRFTDEMRDRIARIMAEYG